jgi:flagella basal body P-ring formation protein FlgA
MIRIATLVAAAVLAVPTWVRAAEPAGPTQPALKAAATVGTEIVRIGDLVENAGAVANIPIFRAPDLGQTGSVPASRVAEAVRPHHILNLDTRGLGEIAVTRASRAITTKDVESRILRALAGQHGLSDAKSLAVVFDNEVRSIQVEPTAAADLAIARMSFEPRTGRFDVTFELPGSAAARRLPLRFTGSLSETVELVVPARAVAQGEVLKDSDLTFERLPKTQLTPTSITAIEQAIGYSPKRPLRAGQPLRQADLIKQELVQRNEIVAIGYEVPGIALSIRGKALEPGALGDVINVLNIESKRTIQATVIGTRRVSVKEMAPRIAANIGSESAAQRRNAE